VMAAASFIIEDDGLFVDAIAVSHGSHPDTYKSSIHGAHNNGNWQRYGLGSFLLAVMACCATSVDFGKDQSTLVRPAIPSPPENVSNLSSESEPARKKPSNNVPRVSTPTAPRVDTTYYDKEYRIELVDYWNRPFEHPSILDYLTDGKGVKNRGQAYAKFIKEVQSKGHPATRWDGIMQNPSSLRVVQKTLSTDDDYPGWMREKSPTHTLTTTPAMEISRTWIIQLRDKELFFDYNEDEYLTLDRSHHNLFPMPCYPRIWTPASIGSCQEAGPTTTLYSMLSKYHGYWNSVLERIFRFLIQSYQGPIIYLFGTFFTRCLDFF
jgi:hypothetical protein